MALWQLATVLFGALFTVAAMLAAGLALIRAAGVKCARIEREALAFVAGGAALSLLVFLLCAAGVAGAAVFLAVGVALVTAGFRRGDLFASNPSLPPLPKAYRLLFWAAFVPFGVLYLIHAMAPEMSPDGSAYHLGLVARYLREGGFQPVPTNFLASFPQAVEMLFLFAFAFGRHSAAALVHFAFTVTLALLIVCYGRRFGHPRAGVCAALLVFASPVVGKDGASAYNDVAVACIGFAVFYLMQLWRERREPRLLALGGFSAGFAFAAKYTAFVAVLYAVLTARAKRPILLVIACALPMIAPWLVKNWLFTGNPVSPFFNSVFPNPYVHPSFERDFRAHLRRYGLADRSQVPLEVTMRGTALNGLTGPVFLLAPFGLLALRTPQGRQVLAAAAVFGLPYFGNIGTRFLIPCLPFLALALSMAAARVPGLAPALAVFHAISAAPPMVKAYAAQHAWFIDRFPLAAALRLESEESYLRRAFPAYDIARLIESQVPHGESVFTFIDIPYAYTSRNIRVAYQSASNQALGDILWTPLVPSSQPTVSLIFRFPETSVRAVRLVQLASDPEREWSVAELHINAADLTARPNRWEARMAADGSPVTRWRSREPARPGMFVQAGFAAPLALSELRADCADRIENTLAVKLLGLDAAGTWRELSSLPEIVAQPPPGNLRREAVRQMKRRGAGYLLVFSHDLFAADYSDNRNAWGLTLAGETAGAKLFRLN